MGAWSFVRPCIKTSTRKLNNMERKPRYIGRPTAAAPAAGLSKVRTTRYHAFCGNQRWSFLSCACVTHRKIYFHRRARGSKGL